MKNFPSFSQWKQIFKVLRKEEKVKLLIFFLIAMVSFLFLTISFYLDNTKVVPASGGVYKEGVIGQPRFINPIYGETNDVDRALIDLVFSGLMTYDKKGKIVEDLVDTYEVLDDGKTYEFQLKDNIFWHDGKTLTTDDIIFTIKTIQNSDYKSPLRANWIDIEVEKISDKSLRFKLKSPYNSFLENLTVKIIPKHIWNNIPSDNFALSSYNLQPIGSGPYQFRGINQIASGLIKNIYFDHNRKYYNKPALISDLHFYFFEKKEDLIKAVKSGEINGFSLGFFSEDDQKLFLREKFTKYTFYSPRYFAAFFNFAPNGQKSPILSDENIRKALSYSINKDDIIKEIGISTKVDSPILPDFFGYNEPSLIYNFDIEKAENLLDKVGFKISESGQREKPIVKTSAFQFKKYLKVGSKGTDVNQLQSCLARLDEVFKNILTDETNGTYGKATEEAVTEFQKKYLSDLKPTGELGASTRGKLNELCVNPSPNSQVLSFTITTTNQPQLLKVAELLKNYWQNIGAVVDINAVSVTDLKPIIKERNYGILLYGEALGAEPDLYPFWHSSQKIDPGLNLSSYENKDVDKLLKEARETLDYEIKKQKLEKLQDNIINNAPALFLYNPDYIYFVSQKISGIDSEFVDNPNNMVRGKIIDPAKRFLNITDWYVKTKRIWN